MIYADKSAERVLPRFPGRKNITGVGPFWGPGETLIRSWYAKTDRKSKEKARKSIQGKAVSFCRLYYLFFCFVVKYDRQNETAFSFVLFLVLFLAVFFFLICFRYALCIRVSRPQKRPPLLFSVAPEKPVNPHALRFCPRNIKKRTRDFYKTVSA